MYVVNHDTLEAGDKDEIEQKKMDIAKQSFFSCLLPPLLMRFCFFCRFLINGLQMGYGFARFVLGNKCYHYAVAIFPVATD